MRSHVFWLADGQFARPERHLPADTRGKPPADDPRVTGGIVHVLKSGRRRVDAPSICDPRKTPYNRSPRRADKDVWQDIP